MCLELERYKNKQSPKNKMETIAAIQWAKEIEIYQKAALVSHILKPIFTSCFGITDEKILIIGDQGYAKKRIAPVMALAYYLAARELRLNAKLLLQEPKERGQEADQEVKDSLKSLQEKNVVFVNVSNKLGGLEEIGKSFRKFCTKKKHRFISAMSLGGLPTESVSEVIDAIDIDYKPLQSNLKKLKEVLDKGKEVHVTSKAGTNLYYGIEGMKALMADGDYKQEGTGGNFPAGETYIPCKGSSNVHGKVVIDGSSRNRKGTLIIEKPITLTIEEGSITKIEGGKEAKALKETLEWAAKKAKHPSTVYRIGELGFGMNHKARIIGSTLVDEKTAGTAHIAIGSNYWMGGSIYAIIHLDQIFKDIKVEVDGKPVQI
jgi:leucyl aminopeptidase (aminopeptidase T)|tara:strand:- start:1127 stop:2251 length:1125 start_codon:yes stop_codon:yes gene_type:complete